MVFINLLTALEGITAVGRHSMSSELQLPGGEAASTSAVISDLASLDVDAEGCRGGWCGWPGGSRLVDAWS
jgi:hypothetical protein